MRFKGEMTAVVPMRVSSLAAPLVPQIPPEPSDAPKREPTCMVFGCLVCNMDAAAAWSLLVAFVLLIGIGVWMIVQPEQTPQLLTVATFLLGVIFPSPIFSTR
jgi:hypothetical protein